MPLVSLPTELLLDIITHIVTSECARPPDAPGGRNLASLLSLSLTCHDLRRLVLPHIYGITSAITPPLHRLVPFSTDIVGATPYLILFLPPQNTGAWTTHRAALLQVVAQCRVVTDLEILPCTDPCLRPTLTWPEPPPRGPTVWSHLQSVAVLPLLQHTGHSAVVVLEHSFRRRPYQSQEVHSIYTLPPGAWVFDQHPGEYEEFMFEGLRSIVPRIEALRLETPRFIAPWFPLLREFVGTKLTSLMIEVPGRHPQPELCSVLRELTAQLECLHVVAPCLCEQMIPGPSGVHNQLEYWKAKAQVICPGGDLNRMKAGVRARKIRPMCRELVIGGVQVIAIDCETENRQGEEGGL